MSAMGIMVHLHELHVHRILWPKCIMEVTPPPCENPRGGFVVPEYLGSTGRGGSSPR